MTTKIICKPTAKGIHSFYLTCEMGTYFLFCQNYRKGVQEFYSKGVSLKNAIDVSKGKKDTAIVRTMNKILPYIRYIEKEYDIKVLDRTSRKERRHSLVA